jgi:addiction module HigA family antidote
LIGRAYYLKIPYQRIKEVVNGKRGIAHSTALRLAKFFNISSDFWLNLQISWDLYFVNLSEAVTVEKIQAFEPTHLS